MASKSLLEIEEALDSTVSELDDNGIRFDYGEGDIKDHYPLIGGLGYSQLATFKRELDRLLEHIDCPEIHVTIRYSCGGSKLVFNRYSTEPGEPNREQCLPYMVDHYIYSEGKNLAEIVKSTILKIIDPKSKNNIINLKSY